MAAPVGNQFWKLRSKHGRDKLFSTPELLWEAACEYFTWCDLNPWVTTKTKSKTNGDEVEYTPIPTPYSIDGFRLYVGATRLWWHEFKAAKHKEFLSVIDDIESVIENQQFNGASVGAYNANIIARRLGLSDRQEVATEIKIKFGDDK